MKPRAGLHRKVSSIFDGVPVPSQSGPADAAPQNAAGEDAPTSSVTPASAGSASPQPDAAAGQTPPVSRKVGAWNLETESPQPKPPTSKAAAPTVPPANSAPTSQPKQTVADSAPTPVPTPPAKPAAKPRRVRPVDPEAAHQRKMTILVGVLFVVFVGILSMVLRGPEKGKAQGSKKDESQAGETPLEITWKLPEPYPQDLRDPMQPVLRPSGSGAQGDDPTSRDQFVVKGIVDGQRGRDAVIGGYVVQAGEQVYGATVVKINLDSVVLEKDGVQWTQPLREVLPPKVLAPEEDLEKEESHGETVD